MIPSYIRSEEHWLQAGSLRVPGPPSDLVFTFYMVDAQAPFYRKRGVRHT